MDKLEVFRQEIGFINDTSLKEFAELAIQTLPDYFFEIPASSSNKYHPAYANGTGGLVRHTKAAMRIAVELYRLEMFNHFTNKDKDIILVSLLLHDGYKQGNGTGNHTITEHPILASFAIQDNHVLDFIIDDESRKLICDNIKSHMGAWVFDKSGVQILEKPQTKMQNFVHLIDYLASRKCLEFNFDAPMSKG